MPHSIYVPDASTAMVYDLTTVEAVNAALGITGDTAADALTADEITAASKRLAEICGRIFAEHSVTETFMLHEYWVHGLPLRDYPVIEIASVTVNDVLLAATDYKFVPDGGLLWKWNGLGCVGWGCGTVEVVYTAGYELPSGAPASLAQACIEWIEEDRIAGERDTSIRDIQHGDRRVSYFNASVSGTNASLPASVADLIRPFKRVVLA